MYLAYFDLEERPFALAPDPAMLFWSKAHAQAYAMMEFGLLSGAPITVITGEVGAGKTTLIRLLLEKLEDHWAVGLISNAQQGRGDMLSWALVAMGEEAHPERTYIENFDRFQKFLIDRFAAGKKTLIIVDEAQNLDSRSIEELRMFTNINADKNELLQLLLVGQPELGDLVARAEHRQFAQRIAAQFHLPNLTMEETKAYIRSRLEAAGGRSGIITIPAANAIYRATRGVPRLINVLAEYALVTAYGQGRKRVSRAMIEDIVPQISRFGAFVAPELEPENDEEDDAASIFSLEDEWGGDGSEAARKRALNRRS